MPTPQAPPAASTAPALPPIVGSGAGHVGGTPPTEGDRMFRPRIWWLVVGLLLPLAGCTAADDDDDTPPSNPSHPCDPVWGDLPATGRLHVDAGATPGGDGSFAAPFDGLDGAVEASRSSGERQIVLAPGDYAGTWLLSGSLGDNGLDIAGCGVDETLLQGVVRSTPIPPDQFIDRLQPVFDVTGAKTADLSIRDLSTDGGRRALIVRDGAGASGPIVLERLDVLDSVRLGVLIDGSTTLVHMTDVRVDGVSPENGNFGWGISVQSGRPVGVAFDESLLFSRVDVNDVQGLGVLVDGGFVEFEDVSVQGVQKAGGVLGRGLQMQNWSAGTLLGLSSFGNSDAAVFLESPGRPEAGAGPTELPIPILLEDCTLGPTDDADVPGSPGVSAAEGLTATQYVAAVPYPAATFLVVLDGTEFAGNERAHVLAETISIQVGGNNVFGKGTTYPVAAQGGALVEGIGGDPPGEDPEFLEGADELELNREPVELDDPATP